MYSINDTTICMGWSRFTEPVCEHVANYMQIGSSNAQRSFYVLWSLSLPLNLQLMK